MKVTLSISLCALVVLLQLMQTTEALQVCSAPSCGRGYLNSKSCECDSSTASTCSSDFIPMVNIHGLCSCGSMTTPECDSGFTLDSGSCECTISTTATCPRGSSLTSMSVRCNGTSEPICPRGAFIHNCQCVRDFVRRCPYGELSWDGCECTTSSTPTCSSGCTLNSDGHCTCDRINNQIHCFSHPSCSEQGRMVSSIQDCCGIGGIIPSLDLQLEIQSMQYYRIGDGPCTACPIH